MFNENSPLYHLHEMQYAAITPLNIMASAAAMLHRHPLSPLSYTGYSKHIAAGAEVLERMTHRYAKPEFGIAHTIVDGKQTTIYEEVVDEKPFCRLLHFKKH